MNRKQQPVVESFEPKRRLSPWRVMLAMIIVCGLGFAGVQGIDWWQENKPASGTAKSWFAAYTDVTATPTYAFEKLGASATKDVVLSFIVSLPADPCAPSWGAAYTMDQAAGKLDLDRRIARLQQQGGSVAVSFGGLLNDELALKCTDTAKLQAAYKSVVERYNINTIDLDLEKEGLTNSEAATRRAEAIANLQAERRSEGKQLAVWLTLPVAPQGLTEDGTNAVSRMLKKKVDLAGVNVMTMDYGGSLQKGQSVLAGSQSALVQTHRQLGILYKQAGIHLSNASLWAKIGATPMIGQNDVVSEIFTVDAAKEFNKFALSKGISRMSMWSANRDIECSGNYVDVKVVSDSCSGVKQDPRDFSVALSQGFTGSLKLGASVVTKSDPAARDKALKADDPKTSPYQIWSEEGSYLQGTKVVWHQNVYQAKWWTQGESPDNPVLQSWQTPWELVGPVLPGEKPVQQATLPAGTYSDWSGDASYDTAQRVLFNGVPYQAKWWNKGSSPAAASANPDGSPWVPLTQAQINSVLEETKNQ